MLKVELSKMELIFKKYKEAGGLQQITASNMIQLPERYLNRNFDIQEEQIINTQTLLDDMNYVKNQLQCEVLKLKSNPATAQDFQRSGNQFFQQRNPATSEKVNNHIRAIQNLNDKNAERMMVGQSSSSQSNIRLQINTLKTKCKLLSEQISRKDKDIERLKTQNRQPDSDDKVKNELRRAYNILKQLKKKLNKNQGFNQNVGAFDHEYQQIMAQIEGVLGVQSMPPKSSVSRGGAKNLLGAQLMNEQQESMQQPHQPADDRQYYQNLTRSTEIKGSNGEFAGAEYTGSETVNLGGNSAANIQELKQKIADLKTELQMSPRQFEDKLLHKLREEIIISKQRMQEQMQQEMQIEQQRLSMQPVS